MKKYKVYTDTVDYDNPTWSKIKQLIMDLPNSNDGFIVLEKNNADCIYIQTCLNGKEFREEGTYSIEIRRELDDKTFQHFRKKTDEVADIIDAFADYFNEQPVSFSDYKDVSDEFLDSP